MKIFISGIAGFLGSHLADAFLNEGFDVVGVDNLIGGYEDNVPNGVNFFKSSMDDLLELDGMLKDVDIVYHTACTAYEGLSVFSPSLVSNNTYQISVNLMTAAIRNNVRKFVHCSSMARYGSQPNNPFTEDMVCKPQDPYGIAKYAAELALQNLSETHGTELVIAIPHNIVGPRQKYDDPFRNVASIMINLMLQNRQPIIYGDGEQIRCFSDIRDDISILVKFATDDKAVGEIFNIGPDEEPVTINKLAIEIADILNFPLEPIYEKGRPNEVFHATCSADKIRKFFGYETMFTLRDTLESLVDYIQSRGARPFEYHLPIEINNDKTPSTWTKKKF
jgi:UDP-glucose 4-epimerase